jgi:hypothetical protein
MLLGISVILLILVVLLIWGDYESFENVENLKVDFFNNEYLWTLVKWLVLGKVVNCSWSFKG